MYTMKLTYGQEGFSEISKFLYDNYDKNYTLSIFDMMTNRTVELICDFDDMVSCIMYISNVEHDFPEWIGKNELSYSYVVGMNFVKGSLNTPAVYKYQNGCLTKLHQL